MKHIVKFIKNLSLAKILLPLLILITVGCTTVPVTGRSRVNFIPDSSIMATSFQEYDKFLRENELSDNVKQTAIVKRVGNKIRQAVEKYFTEQGMTAEINNYKWEFNLVKGEDKNAWCMPGGKVVVYEGIMPAAKNENGLAVVMGHEIAHAVAKHGNERMSQGLLIQTGGALLSAATNKQSAVSQQAFMTAYGIGAQLGFMLPYSRVHEKEADYLGLIFMTMAGYNPNEAVGFWQRMQADGGSQVPEFLSTHPSGATRISEIKAAIPEILSKYK
ncbi:MAG: M48 family metallopeptidase [Deltaproteobacteria bacterium]|nr:M48 family metallopeptidase [Deltaproteobacteria bacterium]